MKQLANYFVHRKKFKHTAIDYARGTIEAVQDRFPFRRKKYFLSVDATSDTITRIEVTVKTRKNFRLVSEKKEEETLCNKFYSLI